MNKGFLGFGLVILAVLALSAAVTMVFGLSGSESFLASFIIGMLGGQIAAPFLLMGLDERRDKQWQKEWERSRR